MARQKKNPPETIDMQEVPATPMVSAEALVNVEHKSIEHYQRALQIAGELRAHHAYHALSKMALVHLLQEMRDTKCYEGLPYTDENGNHMTVSSIKQFFTHYIGVSYSKVAEEAQRIEQMGEEGYSAAKQIGFTREHFRIYGVLPDDQKAIVDEALQAKNKDAVLEILELSIAKHAKEKEAAEKKISDLEATVEAKDQLLVNKDKKINSLDEKLKLNKKKTQQFDYRIDEYLIETTRIGGDIMSFLDRLNQLRDVFLNDDFGEENETADKMMAENYYHVMQQVAKYMEETAAACEEVFSGYIE